MKRMLAILALSFAVACGGSSTLSAGDGAAAELEGEYLLTFKDRPVPQPATLHATITSEDDSIVVSLQALRADDRVTPAGSPTTHGPTPVDGDGLFALLLDDYSLPDGALPLPDSGQVNDVILSARETAPLICGDIEYPSPGGVEGGTFALVPITDPPSYPQGVMDCDGTPAPPL